MRSTRTTSGRGALGARWTLAFVTLLVTATLGLVACGGSSSSGAATPAGGASRSQSGGDSFTAAWPKAQDAMAAVAPDAVLVASGTSGLALTDVPDSWSFTYFSPEKNAVYSVNVEHGKAGAPKELGAAKQGVKVKSTTDIAAIKVSPADAVVMARAFGEQAGTVPKNVVVAGIFAELPGAGAAGYKSGVWTVAFATGTDMADAQTFEVDMMTGGVTKVKSK
jgi:hypothetical protein